MATEAYCVKCKAKREMQDATKITMKNGRTLTMLILTDGKWLSDTIWLK